MESRDQKKGLLFTGMGSCRRPLNGLTVFPESSNAQLLQEAALLTHSLLIFMARLGITGDYLLASDLQSQAHV